MLISLSNDDMREMGIPMGYRHHIRRMIDAPPSEPVKTMRPSTASLLNEALDQIDGTGTMRRNAAKRILRPSLIKFTPIPVVPVAEPVQAMPVDIDAEIANLDDLLLSLKRN